MYEQTMLETAVLQHCHFAMAMAKFVMLDIIMCITFLSVQNKYPATRFILQNFDKNGIFIIKSNMQLRRLSVMSGNIWYDFVCITLYSIIFYVTGYQQLTFFRSSSQLLVTGYQQLTFFRSSSQLLVTGYQQLTFPGDKQLATSS